MDFISFYLDFPFLVQFARLSFPICPAAFTGQRQTAWRFVAPLLIDS